MSPHRPETIMMSLERLEKRVAACREKQEHASDL